MKRPKVLCAAVTFALAVAPQASLTETPLSGVQLRENCLGYEEEPRSSAGLACAAYVRGFLDGAAALDGRVRTGTLPEPSSKTPQRPADPAAVPRRSRTYCVDSSITIDRIISEILQYTSERAPDGRTTAGELLDAVLKRFHACPH